MNCLDTPTGYATQDLLPGPTWKTCQAIFTAPLNSPLQRTSPTHHDGCVHARQVEDIRAGFGAAYYLSAPPAGLGKVEVGAVWLPGKQEENRHQHSGWASPPGFLGPGHKASPWLLVRPVSSAPRSPWVLSPQSLSANSVLLRVSECQGAQM